MASPIHQLIVLKTINNYYVWFFIKFRTRKLPESIEYL